MDRQRLPRVVGLLGGMSWESTAEYYRLINEGVRARRGGLHSAECLLYSVDFAAIEAMQERGAWDEAGAVLADAAAALERGGAGCVLLCTNTMHKVAPAIEAAVDVPLLHIAEATAEAVCAAGLQTVGLLGTRFTMEQDFYRGRLEAAGLRVVVPELPDRIEVHRIIYDELCQGRVLGPSRAIFTDVLERLARAGAQGAILGCTEIGLLVDETATDLPLFDTTVLHAAAAVHWLTAP